MLIPVLARPQRVQPLVESLAASVRQTPARPVFLCTPGDDEQIAAVREAGVEPLVVPWPLERGDYSRKMNLGFDETSEAWVFLAADDLVFGSGWIEQCLSVHQRAGACVVGTNDLGNNRVIAGHHSTHTMVHRDYGLCGTIDGSPGRILHEGYGHEFVDDEFIATAKWRGTYASAREAIVEHMHPDWGKGEWDATYERGRSMRWDDQALFQSREHLWGGRSRFLA